MRLDSPEAKARDEDRADRFEAEAKRLETRVTRHIMSHSKRGGIAVSHTTNFLQAKARRLKHLASGFRYRNRRKIAPQSNEDWPS